MTSQEDITAMLRATVGAYRELLIEANDRASAFKANAMVLDDKIKALQAENDNLKAAQAEKEAPC